MTCPVYGSLLREGNLLSTGRAIERLELVSRLITSIGIVVERHWGWTNTALTFFKYAMLASRRVEDDRLRPTQDNNLSCMVRSSRTLDKNSHCNEVESCKIYILRDRSRKSEESYRCLRREGIT